MKIFLYHDTASYHAGSWAVMHYLRERLEAEGHEIVQVSRRLSPESPRLTELLDGSFEAMVVNGEGSMHHNRPGALMLRDAIQRAKEKNKKVYLVNSLWEDMGEFPRDLMLSLDGVQLREGKSARDFEEQYGFRPAVFLDFSFFSKPGTASNIIDYNNKTVRTDFLCPDFNNFVSPTMGPLANYPQILLQKQPWVDCIESLKTASLLLCGRHHAVYACAKARTPFVAMEGNSHKIEGIFADSGVKIPIAKTPAELLELANTALETPLPWHDLYNWMESQPRWPGLSIFS